MARQQKKRFMSKKRRARSKMIQAFIATLEAAGSGLPRNVIHRTLCALPGNVKSRNRTEFSERTTARAVVF